MVQVFDSLYTTASTTLKKQIATFLTTMKPSITLHFMDVQMQSGGSDCGLFAIAFATALVDGKKPGKFLFQQGEMQAHLCKCLELGKMTPFPIIRNRRTPSKIKAAEQFNVYCICRMPEIANSTWVQCTACKDGFILTPVFPSLQNKDATVNCHGIVPNIHDFTIIIIIILYLLHYLVIYHTL